MRPPPTCPIHLPKTPSFDSIILDLSSNVWILEGHIHSKHSGGQKWLTLHVCTSAWIAIWTDCSQDGKHELRWSLSVLVTGTFCFMMSFYDFTSEESHSGSMQWLDLKSKTPRLAPSFRQRNCGAPQGPKMLHVSVWWHLKISTLTWEIEWEIRWRKRKHSPGWCRQQQSRRLSTRTCVAEHLARCVGPVIDMSESPGFHLQNGHHGACLSESL